MSTIIRSFWKLLAIVKNPLPLVLDRLGLSVRPYQLFLRDGTIFNMRPHRGDRCAFNEVVLWDIYSFPDGLLSPNDCVIDVGANIGCFSIVAAKAVGPTGKVIAIEPEVETFRQLESNVAINNLTNVVVKQVAVAHTHGTASLHLADNAVHTSLLQHMADRSRCKGVQEVATVTIEDILDECGWDRCQLLKLDCEGAEHNIVANMTAETALRIDHIAMEIHEMAGVSSDSLISRLESFGFLTSFSRTIPGNVVHFRRKPTHASA